MAITAESSHFTFDLGSFIRSEDQYVSERPLRADSSDYESYSIDTDVYENGTVSFHRTTRREDGETTYSTTLVVSESRSPEPENDESGTNPF